MIQLERTGALTGKGTRDGVRRLGAGMAIAWSLAACEGLLGFASFEEPPRGDAAVLDGAGTLEGSASDGAGTTDANGDITTPADDASTGVVEASAVDGSTTLQRACDAPNSLVCLPFDTDFENHGSTGGVALPTTSASSLVRTPGRTGFGDAGLFTDASS